jgi:hypothetical protein
MVYLTLGNEKRWGVDEGGDLDCSKLRRGSETAPSGITRSPVPARGMREWWSWWSGAPRGRSKCSTRGPFDSSGDLPTCHFAGGHLFERDSRQSLQPSRDFFGSKQMRRCHWKDSYTCPMSLHFHGGRKGKAYLMHTEPGSWSSMDVWWTGFFRSGNLCDCGCTAACKCQQWLRNLAIASPIASNSGWQYYGLGL